MTTLALYLWFLTSRGREMRKNLDGRAPQMMHESDVVAWVCVALFALCWVAALLEDAQR